MYTASKVLRTVDRSENEAKHSIIVLEYKSLDGDGHEYMMHKLY